MIGRGPSEAVVAIAVLASATSVAAQPAPAPLHAPRGHYEAQWRQVDGGWTSQPVRTTLRGCAFPAHDDCGKPAGGPFAEGATLPYNAFGCVRPAITIRCEVRPTGGGRVAATGVGPAFVSGRYLLHTSVDTAVVDLTVTRNRFRGVASWNGSTAAADPIVDGRIRGGLISFRLLCGQRIGCVRRFDGTLVGAHAGGLWAGSGSDRAVSWTLEPE